MTCKNHLNEFLFVRLKICKKANFFEQIHAQTLCLVDDKDSHFIFLVRLHKELMQLSKDRVLCAPFDVDAKISNTCLLYTSPSPRDGLLSRMPSSA